jgi:PEP-CTERM motif
MLKMFKIVTAAACLALGLVALPAQAAFINGLLTVSDTYDPAFLPLGDNSVVSELTSFHPFPPQPTGNAGGGTGDFTGTVGLATLQAWNFAPCPGAGCAGLNEIAVNGFTFNITGANITAGAGSFLCDGQGNCADTLTLHIAGVVSHAGFSDTAFSGTLALTGSCNSLDNVVCNGPVSGGYTYSLSANGRNVVPEPGSLALIGVALAGMAAFRRRRKS